MTGTICETDERRSVFHVHQELFAEVAHVNRASWAKSVTGAAACLLPLGKLDFIMTRERQLKEVKNKALAEMMKLM